MKKDNAILADLDGTLALFEGRRKWFEFDKVEVDEVRNSARKIVTQYYDPQKVTGSIFRGGGRVIIVTGRPETCRTQTMRWLVKHKIPFTELFMREKDDDRKDTIVKYEIYLNDIQPKYNIEFVLEDRNSVVEMYRGIGLDVYQVALTDY